MSPRVLILGLDGMTFDVVDPLMARGRMPNLATLAAHGVRASLHSTVPPVSAPAWVTFLTGKHPGKHGVFNFQNLDGRRYTGFSERLVNSSYFRGDTLLDHVGRSTELRSLAYRIPMTYPAWDVPNGVVVSGPPVPDRRRAYAAPAQVEAEIGTASPLSHDELETAKRARDVGRIDACNRFELDLLERTVGRYVAAGTELVIGFTGIPDGLHHTFWGMHDVRSPVHEPDAPAALRSIVERWYEEIDAMIGRILRGCDDDTAVIVLSDHGGGPAPTRFVNLNAALCAAGLLSAAGAGRANVASGVRRLADRARERLPGRTWLKRHLPERVQRGLRDLRNATGAIAWEGTQAYAVPLFYPITAVWVNLAGRQPKGIVAPGAEYERVRDELVRLLGELRDPDTGARLVTGVWRREDVYAGGHVEDAPDIVVETAVGHHGGFELDRVVSDVPLAALRTLSGSHAPDGILIAAGGPFRRGVTLDPPSLADTLPTALHLLGVALPDDLDGRVLAEALDPAWVAAHPIQTASRAGGAGERVTLSGDDEGEMRKFLQGLGYVE
ncbi:MAG TPA: alkaline phosphatase family protein [Candidatus Binatia bacterium]|nr:alkaline phosphatase family protein [Candidatus Binatia bacterium]